MSMNSFHSRSSRAAPKAKPKPAEQRSPEGMQRADVLLVAQKHAESRTRARQLIEAGRVRSDVGPITKPGHMLPETAVLTVADDERSHQESCGATGQPPAHANPVPHPSSAGASAESKKTANS